MQEEGKKLVAGLNHQPVGGGGLARGSQEPLAWDVLVVTQDPGRTSTERKASRHAGVLSTCTPAQSSLTPPTSPGGRQPHPHSGD